MEKENSIPTNPKTGEVEWSDETVAWFEKWEVEENYE